MKSRCIGELLLRPAALSRPVTVHISSSLCRPALSTQRCFNTSTTPAAPRVQWSSENKAEPQHKTEPQRSQNSPSPYQGFDDLFRPSQDRANSADTSATIDELMDSVGLGNSSLRRQPGQQSGLGSSGEFRMVGTRRPFGESFSKQGVNLRPKALDFENMTWPNDVSAPAPPTPAIREEDIVYPRLNPTTGRTVDLDNSKGRDIVRGINMLGSLMARNKIRADFHKQRFHERPGLKRKRLKSERWRARFKVGFQDVCSRVTELTTKGW